MQTVIERIGTKVQNHSLASNSTMEGLKQSIDYLSHFLITKNLDLTDNLDAKDQNVRNRTVTKKK